MTHPAPGKPSFRRRYALINGISCLVTFAVVAVLAAHCVRKMLPYSAVRSALDQRAGDGSADLYTVALHQRVVTAMSTGVIAALLGLFVLAISRSKVTAWWRSLIGELGVMLRSLASSLVAFWPALALTGLVATLARWPFMYLPMRFDESYTYLQYASPPLYVTVSKYDAPNNHVLHSVLVWLATRIGGNSPEVIRSPAFLCGVLTAILAAWWVARRTGRWWGMVTGCMVAVSSPLVEYSVNARGYTLVHLLLMWIWVISDEWSHKPSRAGIGVIAVLSTLALWTMPTAIYPLIVLGVCIWGSTYQDSPEPLRLKLKWEIARAVSVTLILTLLLYAPLLVVSGVSAITSSGQGLFSGLLSWGRSLVASLHETCELLFRDQPYPAIGVLLAGLAISQRLRKTALWMGIGLTACLFVIAIQRVVPPPRTWLFLWPIVCCLGVAGFGDGVRDLSPRWNFAFILSVLLIGGVWPGVRLLRNNSITTSMETGVCPEAEEIIADLKPLLAPGEPIIAVSPASAPLAYYAARQGLAAAHFFAPTPQQKSPYPAIIIVARDPHQTVPAILAELHLNDMYRNHRIVVNRQYSNAVIFRLIPSQ